MMRKTFNTTAVCIPGEHYMVDISGRLQKIKEMIAAKKYFTINRARQYGKTTTLQALFGYLQSEYYTVLLDFQTFDASKFKDGNIFSIAFAGSFLTCAEGVNQACREKYCLGKGLCRFEKCCCNQLTVFTV